MTDGRQRCRAEPIEMMTNSWRSSQLDSRLDFPRRNMLQEDLQCAKLTSTRGERPDKVMQVAATAERDGGWGVGGVLLMWSESHWVSRFVVESNWTRGQTLKANRVQGPPRERDLLPGRMISNRAKSGDLSVIGSKGNVIDLWAKQE